MAEGVESLDAHLRLARLGCDQGQGYHYAPALDPAGFSAWLLRTEDLTSPLGEGLRAWSTAGGSASVAAMRAT